MSTSSTYKICLGIIFITFLLVHSFSLKAEDNMYDKKVFILYTADHHIFHEPVGIKSKSPLELIYKEREEPLYYFEIQTWFTNPALDNKSARSEIKRYSGGGCYKNEVNKTLNDAKGNIAWDTKSESYSVQSKPGATYWHKVDLENLIYEETLLTKTVVDTDIKNKKTYSIIVPAKVNNTKRYKLNIVDTQEEQDSFERFKNPTYC